MVPRHIAGQWMLNHPILYASFPSHFDLMMGNSTQSLRQFSTDRAVAKSSGCTNSQWSRWWWWGIREARYLGNLAVPARHWMALHYSEWWFSTLRMVYLSWFHSFVTAPGIPTVQHFIFSAVTKVMKSVKLEMCCSLKVPWVGKYIYNDWYLDSPLNYLGSKQRLVTFFCDERKSEVSQSTQWVTRWSWSQSPGRLTTPSRWSLWAMTSWWSSSKSRQALQIHLDYTSFMPPKE